MKCLTMFVLLAVPDVMTSQSPNPSERPFAASPGTFFALSVGDMQASRRWYQEKLGLKVVLEIPHRDKSEVTVLTGGGLTVELVHHDEAHPLSKAAPAVRGSLFVHGIFKVGLTETSFRSSRGESFPHTALMKTPDSVPAFPD